MPENLEQDTLKRLNTWLERLEDQARKLLDVCVPEELDSAQAAHLASKYIMLIARLLTLRQQFLTEATGEEERLLRIIFGEKQEQLVLNEPPLDP